MNTLCSCYFNEEKDGLYQNGWHGTIWAIFSSDNTKEEFFDGNRVKVLGVEEVP